VASRRPQTPRARAASRPCSTPHAGRSARNIYVANAGIAGQSGLGDDEAAWERSSTSTCAPTSAAKAVVPEWLERASGHFAAVASAAGLLTQLGAAPYSVTKHAAVGFAEWLAIKYGDNGIGVSCVCPMGVETPVLRGMSNSSDAEFQVAAARPRQCGDRPRVSPAMRMGPV
jgi:NAD(P)-dependent dehydrogenase (short-subunit alcohol dehydrogenase family)